MALKDSFRSLRRRPLIALLVMVAVGAGAVVAVLLGGGSGGKGPAAVQGSAAARTKGAAPPAGSPGRAASGLAALARGLPLEQKVAQLFLFGVDGKDTRAPVFGELSRLGLGGLVFTSDNYSSPGQIAGLTAFAGQVARRARHVAPWLLTEQDGGEFNEFRDLPPKDSPSDIQTVQQAAMEAAQAASALHRIGINGVLGPDVDVDTGSGGAYTRLSFSDVPAEVAQFAAVTVRAFTRERMLTAPKHFPGLGAADQPTDDGPANVGLTVQQLGARDLVPFKAAFQAGSLGVLVGHGLYTTDDFVTPASESVTITTDLLRGPLHFGGIAITDDLESPAVTNFEPVPNAAVDAVKAGADIIWISGPAGDQDAAYQAVLDAARRGQIAQARIDQALSRVLQVKQQLGLIRGQ